MVEHLRDQASTAKKRLGHRGAILGLLGIIFILLGVNFATNAASPALQEAYNFPLRAFPLTFWAGGFIGAGFIGLVTAFLRLGQDGWGFSVLAGYSALWTFLVAVSTAYRGFTGGVTLVLIWVTITTLVSLVSGMRGPDDDD